MNIVTNRRAGLVLVIAGMCWLAVFPALLLFLVSMEARADTGSDEALWRLWRALETLLVEPTWLAYTLSFLMLGASLVGIALLEAGVPALIGKPRSPKWVAAAIA